MALSESQVEEVRRWISDGADISQIQKRLSSEFGLNMTYMDVRFLVDDLGETIKDKPEPREESLEDNAAKTSQPGDGLGSSADTEADPNADSGESPQGQPGALSVSMSSIQRPGALASGDVVFSDGGKAEWVLDQQGRLALIPAVQGYNPPQSDLPEFQRRLSELFSSM